MMKDLENKCVLTGYVGNTEVNLEEFVKHKAKTFDMKYIPTSNLLSVKYFLPMLGGYIDGIYKVSRMSLNTDKTDGKIYIHINLDNEFIKFGDKKVLVYKDFLGSGQMHSLKHIIDLYYEKGCLTDLVNN